MSDFARWTPSEESLSLSELVEDAARHWDGADDHEWKMGADVLADQVDLIYERQHQPWHDEKRGKHGEPMFAEETVKHWIATAIKNNALTLREYIAQQKEPSHV